MINRHTRESENNKHFLSLREADDTDRKLAEARLMFELARGEMSACDDDWISEEQINEEFKEGQ